MPEQLEMTLNLPPEPLPEIVTLEEFLAQMEREYGDRLGLRALRAAVEGNADE